MLPAVGMESQVAANTHSDTKEHQLELVRNNPYTYIKVVKPYLIHDEEKDPQKHFPLAKEILDDFIQKQILVQDEKDSFYLYKQTDKKRNLSFLGLIATLSVDDYFAGKIKVHENTITEKENQLIEHIDISGVIGEPVLTTHLPNAHIKHTLESIVSNTNPDIDFDDLINRNHQLYKITDVELMNQISKVYQELNEFYIADGHHRSAASAGYYKKISGEGHYLSYIVSSDQLHIESFHRAYKCNGQFNLQQFIDSLHDDFEVEISNKPVCPSETNHYGLVCRQGWYSLKLINKSNFFNSVEKLDVSIVEGLIFKKRLNITDSKTDNQLEFIKGTHPVEELEEEVRNGHFDIAISLSPCTIQQVFDVADDGLIMPPKSTYIEPKLLTGLTIQKVK